MQTIAVAPGLKPAASVIASGTKSWGSAPTTCTATGSTPCRDSTPNYFFECVAWVAYLPIGINLAGGYPWGWATLIAPVTMYWLLVHVSGIPPLEAHMLRSRPEPFRAYQARVRAFWPVPKS